MEEDYIRWVAFQPLIGGCAIGAQRAFGSRPTAVLDYDGVGNSELYINYINNIKGNNIPHFIIDGGAYSKSETLKSGNWDAEEFQNLDVVVGVPICAGLSSANCASAGSDKAMGPDAVQNNNMIGMAEIVFNKLRPKVYIFENAVKLSTSLGAPVRELLIKIANDNGYAVTLVKCDTLNHGLPQHRTRTFFIACKGEHAPLLTFKKSNAKLLEDVVYGTGDNEPLEVKFIDCIIMKWLKKHFGDAWREELAKFGGPEGLAIHLGNGLDELIEMSETDKQRAYFSHIKAKVDSGKNYMSYAPGWLGPYKINSLYARSMGRFLHPTEERGYSLRECMRLMGMPDDFPILKKQAGTIGQNVPTTTAEYYCNQVYNILLGNVEYSDSRNILQDFLNADKIKTISL